VQPLEFNMA